MNFKEYNDWIFFDEIPFIEDNSLLFIIEVNDSSIGDPYILEVILLDMEINAERFLSGKGYMEMTFPLYQTSGTSFNEMERKSRDMLRKASLDFGKHAK